MESGKTAMMIERMMAKIEDPHPSMVSELRADLLIHGVAAVKDGKRIDPRELFARDEED